MTGIEKTAAKRLTKIAWGALAALMLAAAGAGLWQTPAISAEE
ncbi:MAG: peptide-methionine (S)-S-oxide reductase, partial [Mesorhizobium sp.]